jgi:hypothetical protein
MSQYPPGGPQGYPPNFPPGGPQGFGPQGYSLPPATRTSAAAITSLVCGLLMCIPLVTGLVAVLTGIIGISATSNPAIKGRGMAIAGLILGLISLAVWGGGGYLGYAMYQRSGPDRAFAQQYIADLVAGKIDQCVQSSTGNIAQQQLQDDYKQSQAWGTFQTAVAFPNSWNFDNGKSLIGMTGVCTFTGGPHKFVIAVAKDGDTRKVDSFQWTP